MFNKIFYGPLFRTVSRHLNRRINHSHISAIQNCTLNLSNLRFNICASSSLWARQSVQQYYQFKNPSKVSYLSIVIMTNTALIKRIFQHKAAKEANISINLKNSQYKKNAPLKLRVGRHIYVKVRVTNPFLQ